MSLREADRVERARRDAELTLGEYQTLAHLKQEIDRIDSELLGGAAWDSYCREVGLLRKGLALSGGSQAALELLNRKLDLVSNANNRRLASLGRRGFGA
ncbi:MAG TPA: hypothetical protein VGI76_02825 [Solirubrobacteraceae bacterium]